LQYQDHCRSTHSTGRTIIACMMDAARTKKSRRPLTVVRRDSSFRVFVSVGWLLLRYETATSRPGTLDAHDAAAVVLRTRYHGMSRTGLPAASCLWLAHSPASLQNVRPAASLHCQRASLALLSRPARSLYTQHVVAPNVPFSIIPFASHASPVSTRRCKQLGTRLTTRQGAAGLAALRPVHAARMARDASWAPP
jgi:hypothetical protein